MKKHPFSFKKAHEIQRCLSRHIVSEDILPERIRLVGGVDVAYFKDFSIGAAAVLDFDTLELVESQIAICKTCFPYIPTLLSFREVMPTVMSIRKLRVQPDVFLVDAHGFAHPYRCGFASHLGLVLKSPTIGVAKTKLLGDVENRISTKDISFISNRGEIIGAAVTTIPESRPMYVSVGHMVSLKTSINIVKHCTKKSRIPKPILEAHETATTEKRKINISTTVKPIGK